MPFICYGFVDKLLAADWPTIISSLIAAMIGGYCTLRGAIIAIKKQAENSESLRKRIAREELIGFLETIKEEISVIGSRYQDTFGKMLKAVPANAPVLWLYPIEEDYFSVYHASIGKITTVRNSIIRSQIVKTYTLCKGLIDTIKLNNKLFEKYYELKSNNFVNQTSESNALLDEILIHLQDHRSQLDIMDNEVTGNMATLIQQITYELKEMETSHD